ncbi:MAG: UpxY family transcription antiterminator [Bryobacterales bacterium]|nr:UpxY family transcription antiterminator [Bryobacterales bacterium]
MNLSWYAIEVAYKKEEAVAGILKQKNYESYLPMHKIRKVWSDRIKVMPVPLFAGYVFCRFDTEQRWLPILTTPGVRQIVSVGKTPAAIPDYEIEAIRTAVRSGAPLAPVDTLEEGMPVLVTRGPFTGIEGSFLRYQGQDRLVLSITLIRRSVLVEIDRALIEPLGRPRHFADRLRTA